MDEVFTLGVEEEYQIVDPKTGELVPGITDLLDEGNELLGENMKPEMLQSMVEGITKVCRNVWEVRSELTRLRSGISDLAERHGYRIVAAGTHPLSHWQNQYITDNDRYRVLEEDLQDVVRSILIFGLHVHVAIPRREWTIDIMNAVRYFLPHILALSTNSPFWLGRKTGLKSYRTIVWQQFPRTGIPDAFDSYNEFNEHVETLVKTGCIDNGKKIWWDVRPHPFFGTLEFRICDMPLTIEESVCIVALLQAIVVKLYQMRQQNQGWLHYRPALLLENKWRAARYGIEGKMIDFGKQLEVPFVDLMGELLAMLEPITDKLGTDREVNYVRQILAHGTGADRQLAEYKRTGDLQGVVNYLMMETVKDRLQAV